MMAYSTASGGAMFVENNIVRKPAKAISYQELADKGQESRNAKPLSGQSEAVITPTTQTA